MSQEFTDHYTILDKGLFPTRAAALKAAGDDRRKVWFVRHGDGSHCTCTEEQLENDDHVCECEEIWDVQHDVGQFVNCAGFLVTVEPYKPEHVYEIFTY